MQTEKQEPIDIVLTEYPLEVLGIRNESYKDKKGVWWVQTPAGYRILKKISNSESTFKHILHATKHLLANGVNLPNVNQTRDHRDYVNLNGTCFVLLDAIEGKNPSYSIPQELETVVKGLARFHKSSKGFFPAPDTKPKYHLGTWIEDYEQQLEDMNKFYKDECGKQEPDAIGKAVIKEFPYFYERGKKALEGLRGKDYSDWVNKASKEGCLCHQDFAAGNLLLHPSGKLYILDTDSLTVDIAARDIRKLLNKVMKKAGKWNLELTKNMFRYYQAENPLTPAEWRVVKLDLLFPHLFLGAMSKYYYKRDKEWNMDKYLQRILEMAQFEKTITPVIDHFDSMIP
ncbi:MAG: CotS family spore coat protein [Clostridia bacterium]|nr:CotS family spore coat protein [Clostridia bacterium]